MEPSTIEKSKVFTAVDILDYMPHAIGIKTIIEKTTGYVSIMSFDAGESQGERVSPFDILIQIIDGAAEVLIEGELNILHSGEVIIIPAHTRNAIRANVRFKMISTTIKSGYVELI